MKKLKMGLVGGGKGSFIGRVHHMAALLDNQIELVCGAFSHDAALSVESGKSYGLTDNRIYGSFEEMIQTEAGLPEDVRMNFITIATPNDLHYRQATAALDLGFHVVCDKPLGLSLQEALQLNEKIIKTSRIFALTHTYTGYPMVKEARQRVLTGQLGKIRRIIVEYPQGWLATPVEKTGQKQAGWRTDPERVGKSCAMGDIGTHAFNLAEYITGLETTHLCADLSTFVPGRKLDDDGSILLRYNNGARAVITASQVCAGEENALKIQVYGEKGGLEWHQMEPNSLIMKWTDRPREVIRTGTDYVSEAARLHTRIPAGHPEGYLEAFANIYRNVALAINSHACGKLPDPLYDFPGIQEGIRGMLFIEKVVESASSAEKWIEMKI